MTSGTILKRMHRLYIPEPLAGVPLAHWFQPLPEHMNYKKELPPNFFKTEVERVKDVSAAEAIVLSNNFKDPLTLEAQKYVNMYADLGKRTGKPVCVFSLGDFTDKAVFDPRVYVLRLSLYKDLAGPRDISIPSLTEDNATSGITVRPKQEKPLVSFCGMGDLPGWRSRFLHVKNFGFEVRALFNKNWRAHKLGIYWRQVAMRACERSPLVDTHFIIRRTFSGSKRTIELDPTQARKEYLDSIVNADFVIAPKGDGNYSNRFLKTLCLGRFPVLTDTNVVLPLEDVIDYSLISVRVPMNRVHETPEYIREFYDSLTLEEWQQRQQLARDVFEKYLRQDSFLRYFFTEVVPKLH